MSKIIIPNQELKFESSRSSGSGGQNINKVNTKIAVRWKFKRSLVLSDFQKSLIARKLKNRINEQRELVIYNQSSRIQSQNKKQAIQTMNKLVGNALRVLPKRKPTKIPRSVKEKRLKEKKIISEKKKLRRKIKGE